MKTYKVTISGPRVLMHNGRLSDPKDPYTRALKEATGNAKGRNKTDENIDEVEMCEFQGGLYHDEKLGPFFPADCIYQSLLTGARKDKLGREMVNVQIEEFEVPLQYKGPRSRAELGKDHTFRLRARARVGGSAVIRTRPMFTDWKMTFHLIIDSSDGSKADEKSVRTALEKAGRVAGIGDWRPGSPRGGSYGKFIVDEFECVADDDVDIATAAE